MKPLNNNQIAEFLTTGGVAVVRYNTILRIISKPGAVHINTVEVLKYDEKKTKDTELISEINRIISEPFMIERIQIEGAAP